MTQACCLEAQTLRRGSNVTRGFHSRNLLCMYIIITTAFESPCTVDRRASTHDRHVSSLPSNEGRRAPRDRALALARLAAPARPWQEERCQAVLSPLLRLITSLTEASVLSGYQGI